jgi:hypothetical protein
MEETIPRISQDRKRPREGEESEEHSPDLHNTPGGKRTKRVRMSSAVSFLDPEQDRTQQIWSGEEVVNDNLVGDPGQASESQRRLDPQQLKESSSASHKPNPSQSKDKLEVTAQQPTCEQLPVICTSKEALLEKDCTLAELLQAQVMACPPPYKPDKLKSTKHITKADIYLEATDLKLESLILHPDFLEKAAIDLKSRADHIILKTSNKLVVGQIGIFHPQFTREYRDGPSNSEADTVDLVRSIVIRPALFGLHAWQTVSAALANNPVSDISLGEHLATMLEGKEPFSVRSSDPLWIYDPENTEKNAMVSPYMMGWELKEVLTDCDDRPRETDQPLKD